MDKAGKINKLRKVNEAPPTNAGLFGVVGIGGAVKKSISAVKKRTNSESQQENGKNSYIFV